MKATVRHIGRISVLDLSGKITIGEGDVVLREEVDKLLAAGRNLIVVNLERITYMDSAGNGELAACHQRSREKYGILKILKPSGKIDELFLLTKLNEFYEIFRDEGEALASFGSRIVVVESCPICKREAWALGSPSRCPSCACEFVLDSPSTGEGDRIVRTVTLPTYPGESVTLQPSDCPAVISISGRIDLFSFDMIDRAYASLLSPRRVLIRLDSGNSLSPQGTSALLGLLAKNDPDDRIVISEPMGVLGECEGVYRDDKDAVAGLGEPHVVKRMSLRIHVEDPRRSRRA